jgi:serine/threonine-protein kinase
MDGPEVILLALFTSALTAGGTVYFIERYNVLPAKVTPTADAVVPELRGLSESDARAAAAGARFSLFVASEQQGTDAGAGTVVRQSILPGHRAALDSPIAVVVASDHVPDVLGAPLAQAVVQLEQRGYSVQIGGAVADDKVPEGGVVRESPHPETSYARPGLVVIQASAGPSEVEVPKLLGTAIPAAKTRLEEMGLKVVVRWVGMAETPTNVVLNQNPAAGQHVKPGTEVQLTACYP